MARRSQRYTKTAILKHDAAQFIPLNRTLAQNAANGRNEPNLYLEFSRCIRSQRQKCRVSKIFWCLRAAESAVIYADRSEDTTPNPQVAERSRHRPLHAGSHLPDCERQKSTRSQNLDYDRQNLDDYTAGGHRVPERGLLLMHAGTC